MPQVPDCFGSDPGPQAQAENCCHDCAYGAACLSVSTQKRPTLGISAGADATLAERGARYGDFTDRARIADALHGILIGDTPAATHLKTAIDLRTQLAASQAKVARLRAALGMIAASTIFASNAYAIEAYLIARAAIKDTQPRQELPK